MLRRHPLLLLVLVLAVVAIACNLPFSRAGSSTPQVKGPEATFTQLARTIEAVLTQTAAEEENPNVEPTNTPVPPTPVPTRTPPPTSTPLPPTAVPCDWALFITDVTIPDGTKMQPGKTFTKTWRLQNFGSCTWTTSYSLIFDSGEAMNGPASTKFSNRVAPGGRIDLSVELTAPSTPGKYKGYWKLRNSAGATFGIGYNANQPFWVEIEVVSSTETPEPGSQVKYDFTTHMCDADWESDAASLPCPGTSSDSAGFVIKLDNPRLETGSLAGNYAIETHPEWVDDGYIQGIYPAVSIKSGYRFQAVIGCRYKEGGSACDVKFFLFSSADGGPWTDVSPAAGWNEIYDNSVRTLDIDLGSLAGKSVKFMLKVRANGSSNQDWALWVYPRIVK